MRVELINKYFYQIGENPTRRRENPFVIMTPTKYGLRLLRDVMARQTMLNKNERERDAETGSPHWCARSLIFAVSCRGNTRGIFRLWIIDVICVKTDISFEC